MLALQILSAGRVCVLALSMIAVAGCSIHPLPENVSRASTFDIVEKIRCEAREGLLQGFHDVLGEVRPHHRFLTDTYVGYDFEFDITEDNNATSGKLEFERPSFTKGNSFALDISASAKLQRSNKREFRILETLKQLYETDCFKDGTRANWLYPITGTIGINEIIRTYMRIEKLTSFSSSDTKFDKFNKDPIVFSDELKFTTELSAGATPEVTLSTVVGSFRLTKASFFGEVKRKDIHTVVVALARDSKAPPDESFERSLRRLGERTLSLRSTRATDAVAQRDASGATRVLFELERRRILREEERLGTRLIDALRLPP